MFENIPFGVYMPGDSPIHRLQARTKLLLLAWFVVWLVVADHRFWHFAPYIVMSCFALGSTLMAGLSLSMLWRRMWLIASLVIISDVVVLFYREGTKDKTLYAIGPWSVPANLLQNGLMVVALVFLALFALTWLRPLRIGRLKRLRRFFVFAVLACGIGLLVLANQQGPLVHLGPLAITNYGFWLAITITVLLLCLFVFSLLLTMTTSPAALVEGLSTLLAPLRRFKLPVDDFSLMALLALRFIPTLIEEVEQLIKAQSARGADIASGTLRERLQSMSILFSSLVQGVLRRAAELATALEARGYRSEGKQTPLYETSLGMTDYVVLAVVLLLSIGSLFV
jgi:energy-coupling factor transport system permease protein